MRRIRITIILVSLIILAAFAMADKVDKVFDKKQKDNLNDFAKRKGLQAFPDYSLSAIVCNTERCDEVKMEIQGILSESYSPVPYHLECAKTKKDGSCTDDLYIKVPFSSSELQKQRELWEQQKLDELDSKEKEMKKGGVFIQKVDGTEKKVR